jgi:hypothetical protein
VPLRLRTPSWWRRASDAELFRLSRFIRDRTVSSRLLRLANCAANATLAGALSRARRPGTAGGHGPRAPEGRSCGSRTSTSWESAFKALPVTP